MKKRLIQVGIVLVLIAIVIVYMMKTNGEEKKPTNEPTNEIMDLYTYYEVEEGDDRVIVYLNREKTEHEAVLKDDRVYLSHAMVADYFNSRFYYDTSVNQILYTTATEHYKYDIDSARYTVNGEEKVMAYPLAIKENDIVYLDMEQVAECSDVQYTFVKEPNRLLLVNEWTVVDYVTIKKDGKIRKLAGLQNPILISAKAGEKYIYLREADGWTCVQSEDGVKGYIQTECVGEHTTITLKSNYVEPVYTNITRDYKINMAWHQVTNKDANKNLENVMSGVTGVNVISPTWFFMCDNDGNIESIATQSYVDKAHSMGMEVWALVENLRYSKDISTYQILSNMESRERLVQKLISETLKYNIDGINVDIEELSTTAGSAYVQFLRELSVECRKNGIVLSIDNYVPSASSYHYDRREQGIIADYVIIMGYDEHYAGMAKSGSTASVGWVEEGIVNTLKTVPAEKVINAIPFYTRIWKQTPEAVAEKDAPGVLVEDPSSEYGRYLLTSEAVSMAYAENQLKKHGVTPTWNSVLGQYYGEYVSGGCTYQIWLEEEESIELKMKLIEEYKLAGVAGWKLSLQKNSVWDIIEAHLD
ncbi:MAG: glycosyl hydrolase family 18 [Lachnospiraceae bacterium]|nr:glycosyl hydrolase family 18 [Lachnospiraceae bacterium]